MSLFERLLNNAKQNQWNDAYEMLKVQYRTHKDIVTFINKHFYHALETTLEWQTEPFKFYEKDDNSKIAEILLSSRLIFIESEPESKIKANTKEAKIVSLLIEKIKLLKGEHFNENTLGIITPYRAQIAEIDSFLTEEQRKDITVDTVERFQGSERDIIVISMAVNQPKMMKNVQSLGFDELIDKKLNVALSRTKQQIVILGNENIMRNAKFYSFFLDYIKLNGIFVKANELEIIAEQA
jgi:DNA replication ATP-dependent helicase Dna2